MVWQKPVLSAHVSAPPLLWFHHLPPAPPLASHVTVVWLRRDLRVDDHAALRAAVHSGGLIAPLYVQTGRATKVVQAALRGLRSSLRERGAELYVRECGGDVGCEVARFCRQVGAKAVYVHRGTAEEEREQERRVGRSVGAGVQVHGLWWNALVGVDELPFKLEALPSDCDAYARRVAGVGVRRPVEGPARVRGIGGRVRSGRIGGSGEGGERAAMRRVLEFCEGGLAVVRQGRVGTRYVRVGRCVELGCVSARRVYWEVVTRVGERSVRRYCMEFELVWRDFKRLAQLKGTPGTVAAVAAVGAGA